MRSEDKLWIMRIWKETVIADLNYLLQHSPELAEEKFAVDLSHDRK
jgi:hypothetical protein